MSSAGLDAARELEIRGIVRLCCSERTRPYHASRRAHTEDGTAAWASLLALFCPNLALDLCGEVGCHLLRCCAPRPRVWRPAAVHPPRSRRGRHADTLP